MDAENIRSFLAKVAEVFEVDASAVQSDFPLAERWDSMAVLAMIALIDEQFGVTVPPDMLSRCASVADVLTLVRQSVEQLSVGR